MSGPGLRLAQALVFSLLSHTLTVTCVWDSRLRTVACVLGAVNFNPGGAVGHVFNQLHKRDGNHRRPAALTYPARKCRYVILINSIPSWCSEHCKSVHDLVAAHPFTSWTRGSSAPIAKRAKNIDQARLSDWEWIL